MRGRWTPFLAAALVLGCASTAIEKDPELRRRAAQMEILSTEEAKGREFKILGEVEGVSCARQAGSTPTEEAARANLKVNAAKLKADAVINVACEEGGVSWSHNCWRTIVCRGDAIAWK